MENLTKKNYSKLSFVFMAFGSVMKALEPIISLINKEKIADWAWQWSQKAVSDLVDKLYLNNGEEVKVEERKIDLEQEATLNLTNELQDEEDTKKEQEGK